MLTLGPREGVTRKPARRPAPGLAVWPRPGASAARCPPQLPRPEGAVHLGQPASPSPALPCPGQGRRAEDEGQASPGGAPPAPAPPLARVRPDTEPPWPCTHPAPSQPAHLGRSQIPTRRAGPSLGAHCSRDNARTIAGAQGRGPRTPHPASVTLAGVTGPRTSFPDTWAGHPGCPTPAQRGAGATAGWMEPLSPHPAPGLWGSWGRGGDSVLADGPAARAHGVRTGSGVPPDPAHMAPFTTTSCRVRLMV